MGALRGWRSVEWEQACSLKVLGTGSSAGPMFLSTSSAPRVGSVAIVVEETMTLILSRGCNSSNIARNSVSCGEGNGANVDGSLS